MKMRKKSNENYFKKSYNLVVNSFKNLNKTFFYAGFFDLLFYAFLFLSLMLIWNSFNKLFINLPQIPVLDPNATSLEEMQQALNALKNFFYSIIGHVIAAFLAAFIGYLIFKSLTWSLTVAKKIELRSMPRYALLNIIWMLSWLILFVALVFLVKKSLLIYSFIALFLIFIYFNELLNIIFFKEKGIFKMIKNTFKIGISKIFYFIIPFMLSVLIIGIILLLYRIINIPVPLISYILFSLLFILFFTWNRFYALNVFDSLNQ